ncbi:MAG: hypothetical protein COA43_09870 [Robiginitomaculum sp.]|nr:MAG: hypothetical protein COA43_09870 [Robiginitomaculum sp.]
MASWLNDFEFRNGKILVKATRVKIPVTGSLLKDIFSWVPFHLLEKAKSLKKSSHTKKPLSIAFTPTIPRPWYLITVCALRAQVNMTPTLVDADVIFYFEDTTQAQPPHLTPEQKRKSLNFECRDISKTKVGTVFESVFGYALNVDPKTYKGRMAVKSETNGVHDGRETQGPITKQDGLSYQRLIDNTIDGLWVEDLRCPVIDGEIEVVFIKRRALSTRFANTNANVTLHSPDDLLSHEERRKITLFAKAMGLDWGGMDILRDKHDGKIYIVDVNKTDMGPPLALSLKDKNKAITILTDQFVRLVRSKMN